MTNCTCTAYFTVLPTEIVRGDTEHWHITFKDADGNALDTTGWDIYLTLRDTAEVADATVLRVIKNTVLASNDATNGEATLTISSNDTQNIPLGKYYFEFKRVIEGLTPADVWTFYKSDKPSFEVIDGVIVT